MTRLAGIASAAFCVGAGVYMLSIHAAAPNSILESIAHGIGLYFIGKGIFIGAMLWKIQYEAEQTARRHDGGEPE
jgi:hypothetical protein